jgi:hypothetical protein
MRIRSATAGVQQSDHVIQAPNLIGNQRFQSRREVDRYMVEAFRRTGRWILLVVSGEWVLADERLTTEWLTKLRTDYFFSTSDHAKQNFDSGTV